MIIKSARNNIDIHFQVLYKEILDLAEKLGIVEAIPRKTSIVQLIITKHLWLFPFLIPCLVNCKTDFLTRIATPISLLYLVPSIIVKNTLETSEATEGMLFSENTLPFPKYLGNELQTNVAVSREGTSKQSSISTWHVWRGCFSKHPLFLLLIVCTLPISSAEAVRSFLHMTRIKNLHQINDVWRALFRSCCYCYALPWEIWSRQDMRGLCKSSSWKTISGYVVWLMRNVEKWQITIDDTAVPFNHALLFLGSWLRNKINSRFHIMPPGMLQKAFWREKHFFWGGEGHGSGPLTSLCQRHRAVTRHPHHWH